MSNRVLTCAFSLGLVASLSVNALAQVSSGTTQQLGAVNGSTETAPAVSGTNLVWTGYNGTNLDVFYQDISTGAAPVNLSNTTADNELFPQVSGTNVVWTHTSASSSGDIVTCVASSCKPTTIEAASSAVHFAHAAIGGNYVVFERISSQYDIDIFDVSIGAAPGPQITRDAAAQMHPRVSGDVVVYEDYNANPSSPAVYGYHVSTSGPAFLIAAPPAATPDIDGNNVVYVGNDAAGNNQIMLYNLATGATTQLTTAASAKTAPRVSGTRVTWADNRNGDNDVYVYDLSTSTETLLAGGPNDQSAPDIDGGRIVYTASDGNGNPFVYLYTFPGTSSSTSSAPTQPVAALPVGCDPTQTDLVDGPMVLTQTSSATISASRSFKSIAGKDYYMCVTNGNADGTGRSSHLMGTVDGAIVLTPTNLGAAASPVAYAAVTVLATSAAPATTSTGTHTWAVAIYAQANTTASISIRVAK